MHRSGIKATKEVKSEISANKGDKTCLFIKIEINKEAFVLKSTGKMGGEKVDKSDFKALQSQLETNTACYCMSFKNTNNQQYQHRSRASALANTYTYNQHHANKCKSVQCCSH
ncbi:hypothetical protein AAMO2058_001542700 [Amorphochlora amoebiformis]